MASDTQKSKKPQHHRGGASGFTLIELLMVVAIIGIVATLTIPSYQNFVNKAKIEVAKETLSIVRNILIDHVGDNNAYPASIDFTSGLDDQGRVVLQQPLRDQINKDLRPASLIYSVNANGFTITAEANDQKHTVLVVTESTIMIQGN